ncbi:hypothetical protein Ddye_024162 [Dipteronia dyeriana]|uniref:RNase H type-1 domain-containing protein n=1 Tax=Dipteronia dyeriana TaxID=168575 RepID=A0AAD9TUB8_9ROSI|nr:hypothetical protein Ddye_024162 [Dipteronia dyeriana]
MELSSNMNSVEFSLFCIITWRVWFLRNSSLHDGMKQDISDVFWWSKNFAAEFRKAARTDRPRCVSGQVVKCNPPESGSFKVNCNTVVDVGGHKIGIGIVIRDVTGFVLATFDFQVANTLAIYKSIIFARDCGLTQWAIESDVEVIVNRIIQGSHMDSISGTILADITRLLSSSEGLTINHFPRLANQGTHGLAKNALVISEDTSQLH